MKLPESKSTSASQQLAAINGPSKEIEDLQQDLASVLFDVLQRRNVITQNFGTNDEEEITKICALFTAANRRIVSQRLLNAYCHNRYPTNNLTVSVDAPESTKEIVDEIDLKQK